MRLILSVLIFSFISFQNLSAQEHKICYAMPMANILVDGNLGDWPLSIPSYSVDHLYFGENTDEHDITASFRIGYSIVDKALYIGIEVTDSDIVIENEAHDINTMDFVYLYLDPVHSPNGGSATLFQAGGDLRDISVFPPSFNPYMPELNWDNVELKIAYGEQNIIYEWKISLPEIALSSKVLGFDLIIDDVDAKDGSDTWSLWKEGFGKSQSSVRLGEVILIEDEDDLVEIQGSVSIQDTMIKELGDLVFTSMENPSFWCKTTPDSTGKYLVKLPPGSYSIFPNVHFTTALNGDSFHEDSRKIIAKSGSTIEVSSNKRNFAPPLILNTLAKPIGLFEEKGVLFQEDFSELKVDRFIHTFQNYFEIPGVSVALIKDGELVYNKAFGTKNNLTGDPITKTTLFEGASTTKTIFAILVLGQAEKGIIDLNKPLYQYLRFPNIEHDERYQQITGRHVLHHQTGLDNWPIGSYSGTISDTEVELHFDPGTDFLYSGEAMNYLGRVIEHLTQKSLSQLFQEEIATNFGMTNSHFCYVDSLADQITMGHIHRFPRFKDKFSGVDSPASSLQSEAGDFSQFMLGLLNKVYLSKESYALIHEPMQVIVDDKKLYDPSFDQGIAHGFFVTEIPEGKVIGHGGNNWDYECKYSIMPEHKNGYVVFTNNNMGDELIRYLELFLLRGEAGIAPAFQSEQ